MLWLPSSPFDTPLLDSPLLRSRLGCVAVTVLLGFGIMLRLRNLDIPTGRSPDEANYTAQAQRLLHEGGEGLRGIAREYITDPAARLAGPPTRAGYLWVLAATMRLTGRTDETAGAILSCSASIGSLVLLALIGIRFFPPWATVYALPFFAIFPPELELARRAWADALVGLLGLAVVYTAMEVTRDSTRRFWHIAFVVVGSVGVVVKEFGAVTFALCALWVVGLLLWRGQRRDAMIVVAAGLAGALAAFLYLVEAVGGAGSLFQIVHDWRGAHVANQYAIEFQSGPPTYLLRAFWTMQANAIALFGLMLILDRWSAELFPRRATPAVPHEITNYDLRNQWAIRGLLMFSLIFLMLPMLLPNWLNLRYVSVLFAPYILIGGLGFALLAASVGAGGIRSHPILTAALVLLVVLGMRGTYPKFRRYFVNDGVGDLSVKLILDRAEMYEAERVVKRRPTAENYLTLCWRYEQNWRYKDSIAACENALKQRPDYAEAYDQLAVAQVDLAEWDAAARAARRALELNPTLPRAKFNLDRAQRELAAQ